MMVWQTQSMLNDVEQKRKWTGTGYRRKERPALVRVQGWYLAMPSRRRRDGGEEPGSFCTLNVERERVKGEAMRGLADELGLALHKPGIGAAPSEWNSKKVGA